MTWRMIPEPTQIVVTLRERLEAEALAKCWQAAHALRAALIGRKFI